MATCIDVIDLPSLAPDNNLANIGIFPFVRTTLRMEQMCDWLGTLFLTPVRSYSDEENGGR